MILPGLRNLAGFQSIFFMFIPSSHVTWEMASHVFVMPEIESLFEFRFSLVFTHVSPKFASPVNAWDITLPFHNV